MSRAACICFALLLAGCHSATEIVVRVESDIPVGGTFTARNGTQGSFRAVSFHLENLGFATLIEPPDPQPSYTSCVSLRSPEDGTGACLPVELGVVAQGDWADRDFGIEVSGFTGCNLSNPFVRGAELTARARARFVEGQVSLLRIQLGSCAVGVQEIDSCPVVTADVLPPYEPPSGSCP